MLGTTLFEAAVLVLVLLVPMLLLALLAVVAVTYIRRRTAERDPALDPRSVESHDLADGHGSPEPTRSAESRLAEAQDLHQRGLVTADELGEMRQRILGEV
jgi:hypothetical protein